MSFLTNKYLLLYSNNFLYYNLTGSGEVTFQRGCYFYKIDDDKVLCLKNLSITKTNALPFEKYFETKTANRDAAS